MHLRPDEELDDLTTQFRAVFSSIAGARPAAGSNVESFTKAIESGQSEEQKADNLAAEMARVSPLTAEVAKPLAKHSIAASKGDANQAATQTASLLSGLTGSASLTLRKPNPLGWRFRIGVAAAMVGILAGTLAMISTVNATGTAVYVSLAVVGGLAWLGSVLFVMGYQNVTLSGSSGSPPPTSGGSKGASS